ncbi:site-specific integrase [Muricauda oceani]|uniref:Site-specific integrase n=1 Tax=Flagellimonas oceani TaxID=2698672 RepID=A0A6G7J0T9_9FLAO|nr:site-specific integrase [Allomuricauda oceani]MBW8245132.1 site-specific integrase [Allomuricauda oceani]QII44218.1 site-specific integrase [Allomuricauda oceani]
MKQQRITTGAANQVEVASINPKLQELKDFLLVSYNEHFANGGVFNKDWLDRIVAKFNNRPFDESENKEIYFVPFVSNYIEESKNRLNPNTGRLIDHKTIQKYQTTLKRLEEFQNKEGVILKLWDIDLEFHTAFLKFLRIDGNYSNTTCNKYISQVKGFCREAKSMGLKVSPEVEHRDFTVRREKPIDVYLNEREIESIFNADFKGNDRLNNVRQLMIIGLWTGLRISDLKKIHEFNFTEDKIEILDSVKTGGYIHIPIHSQIKAVLSENNGELPRVISDVKFNLYMKEVCWKRRT